MGTVREWFDDFTVTLVERVGRLDLPEGGSEYWADFERALVRVGATEAQADEASSVVADVPGLFPNQYRPMVVEAVRKIQARERSAPEADPLTSLDAAKAESRDCPDCLGTGGAVRYVHPEIHGKVRTFGGHVAPVGMAVTYPCSCPLGRFVARGLQPEGSARPVLTVDQYPSLRMGRVRWSDAPDNQCRHRPAHWDAESGMPAHAGECLDVEGLRRLVATTAAPGGAIYRGTRYEPRHGDARALPGDAVPARSELADAIDDPVVRRELARPAPPATLTIPEDHATSGWF